MLKKLFIIGCFVLTLTGCISKRYVVTEDELSGDAHVVAIEDRIQFFGKNISATQERALLAENIIYFEYDRHEVHEDDLLAIYAHAKYLIDHPKARMKILGHTDRHGSPDYNLALGERRARSVKSILTFKGVPETQLEIVSFGKEKMVSMDETVDADRLNRRVEMVLIKCN